MNRFIGLGASAALALCAGIAGAQTVPEAKVVIKPAAMSEAAGKGKVRISITVPDFDVPAGGAVAPHTSGYVSDLSLTDAQGAVPLVAPPAAAGGDNDEGPGPGPGRGKRPRPQPWTAGRAVKGPATLSYTLTVNNSQVMTGGVPIAPRIDGDGFSSRGGNMFVLPEAKGKYRIAIHWDLSAMAPDATGVSTFGDGDVVVPPSPLSRLEATMFMAGSIKREPEHTTGAFQAVWLDTPKFDVRGAMDWTGEMHAWMSKFWGDKTEPPYRVFLRSNPRNPGGGVALGASFAIGYGDSTTAEGLKSILPHEMTHTWTANGVEMGRWYEEGDAVYYQARLPWRAGLITTDRYLADINATAARYYTSPEKFANDARIDPEFFRNPWINVLAYDRGALYFAVLDGKIRRASHGKSGVNDLVRAMVELHREDKQVTPEVWVEMLRKALGPEGPAFHKSMMEGTALMLPESDDYGPCFRRVATKLRSYDQGLTFEKGNYVDGETIKTVEAGSEAEKAGLKVGDMVRYADSSEGTRRHVNMTLTMHVTRDGKTFDITYLPRGAPVDGYQWVRVPGVSDAACKAQL